jgi:hypothetical protein
MSGRGSPKHLHADLVRMAMRSGRGGYRGGYNPYPRPSFAAGGRGGGVRTDIFAFIEPS